MSGRLTDEQMEQIARTVHEIARCDMMTLAAALSLLPDYSDAATSALISAAARILAERFEDTENALESFSRIVRKTREIIEGKERDPEEDILAIAKLMSADGRPKS